MMRSCWIAIIVMIVLFPALPVACAKSDPNTKIADRFEVSFDSARYAASSSVRSPSGSPSAQAPEQLRLYCEVTLLDPNLVLGISSRGKISQFEDSTGKIVNIVDQTFLPSMGYAAPRYRRRFVAPTRPPKWKRAIRSILRLPPPKRSRPQWAYTLEPSRVRLELDCGLLGPDCEKISRLKGHFYVLMAESFEHTDIPFRPSEKWVRLTADLEVRVLEAQSSESHYNYRIETRRGETTVWSTSTSRDLPSRLAVKRQFLDADGKPTAHSSGSIQALGRVAGSASGGGSNIGLIERIRFVIAVNPSHHKIAFEIQDIALRPSEVPSAQERKIARVPRQTSGHDLAGTILKKKWTNLSWEAASGAVAYDVYLGESFEDVNNGDMETFQGNQSKTFLVVGFPGFPYPDGLCPGTTYYWRVDEINDSDQESPKKGSIRSFSIAPRAAYDPNPPDGAKSVGPDVQLGWQEGFGAKLHTVYFGDDLDAVTSATAGRPQATRTFDPGTLDLGTTYYWRVDEFDGVTTHKGSVWSFTVR